VLGELAGHGTGRRSNRGRGQQRRCEQADDEPNAAAVLYWFKLVRGENKSVDFVPYLIDDNSGIGTQVVAGDINGDGMPDIVVGNKRGTFVHLQQLKTVSKEEWEKVRPKLSKAPSASASAN